ncbi:PQQ-binding-like beta-propeller repeat protein [Microlunatus speluncae]|uniref:PQQ-binding-like beta-propeller repeat protein n=1 Tax=Microlunatus speluncae TaxID=2594267 RepID=UPI001266242E|nr:PQQ-binding-like beta-propeller repeat protein [Microlunatus speluncae]
MPNRRTLLAALVTVPILGACSAGPGPAARQLKLDKVWEKVIKTEAGRGVAALEDRVALLGDTVVLAEGAEAEPERFTALDAATGARRWSLSVGSPITAPTVGRVLVGGCGKESLSSFGRMVSNPVLEAADDILPLSYVSESGPNATSGVVGVSLATGAPVWGFAATTERSKSRAVITAVSSEVVIMVVAPGFGPHWPTPEQEVSTIALDARTGEKLWSEPDLVGLAADGESVVAAKGDRRSDARAVWTPRVLDARTGEPRWTGEHELDEPTMIFATAADYTVIWPSRPTMGEYEIVQLSTGRRIDYPELPPPTPMATDSPLLVWDTGVDWWSRGPNGFLTQRLPEGKPEQGRRRPGGLEFEPAIGVGPHLWGSYSSNQSTSDSEVPLIGVVAVDRTGGPRSPSVKGILVGVNDRWLVVAGSAGFETHRITPA